jgi:hypothetical protein
MERRKFIASSMITGAMLPAAHATHLFSPAASSGNPGPNPALPPENETVVVERYADGHPHRGKVLAAIQPHCDDIAIYAGRNRGKTN